MIILFTSLIILFSQTNLAYSELFYDVNTLDFTGRPTSAVVNENANVVYVTDFFAGKLVEIDGAIVKLELVGACSSCPSSTTTMKMGIERALKEQIPEIESIEEVTAQGETAELTREGVEEIFEEIRPFLEMVKGSLTIEDMYIGV